MGTVLGTWQRTSTKRGATAKLVSWRKRSSQGRTIMGKKNYPLCLGEKNTFSPLCFMLHQKGPAARTQKTRPDGTAAIYGI